DVAKLVLRQLAGLIRCDRTMLAKAHAAVRRAPSAKAVLDKVGDASGLRRQHAEACQAVVPHIERAARRRCLSCQSVNAALGDLDGCHRAPRIRAYTACIIGTV